MKTSTAPMTRDLVVKDELSLTQQRNKKLTAGLKAIGSIGFDIVKDVLAVVLAPVFLPCYIYIKCKTKNLSSSEKEKNNEMLSLYPLFLGLFGGSFTIVMKVFFPLLFIPTIIYFFAAPIIVSIYAFLREVIFEMLKESFLKKYNHYLNK